MIPKKSLGQNFLRSEGALRKIVEAGNLSEKEVVLEIGPGEGALTRRLLEKAGKVIAIEKDDRLIPILQEKFKLDRASGKFLLIHGDVLEMDIEKILTSLTVHYKLIANIPYYITGMIIQKFLTSENQPEQMVLLVQKEVAERIVARDGKESILSMSVKVYGAPRIIAKVPRGSFHPVPNVDSAILSIENISKNFFTENNIAEENFFEIVKTGFAHKRKRLFGNIRLLLGDEIIKKIVGVGDLSENARAETLALQQWLLLTKKMVEKQNSIKK